MMRLKVYLILWFIMSAPIQPGFSSENTFKSDPHNPCYLACSDILKSQEEHLLSAHSHSSYAMETLIHGHEQELYRILDSDPATRGLPEAAKREFISTEIEHQKTTYLQPLKETESISQGTATHRLGDNPPANEQTLDIDGVSVYVYTVNGKTLYFPVGHSSQGGNNNTPSEAWGYAMRNAIAAGDQAFFQKLADSYLYFCNKTVEKTGMSSIFGLMGWNPDMVSGSYDSTAFATSASDGDEDIIGALIQACQKWPNMTITDPFSSGPHASMPILDLTKAAIQAFVKHDIGSFGGHDPILTLDFWGHDQVFPDYFDPMEFANMITFLKANGGNDSDITRLQSAAVNTMNYVMSVAGKWSANDWNSGNAYENSRLLMRLGEFIASPNASTIFGQGFFDAAVGVLQSNVKVLMPNGEFNPPNDIKGAFLSGPLLVALTALGKIQKDPFPASATQSVFQKYQFDMTQYDIHGGTTGWQNNGYFNMQLGVLSEAIMKQLGIYP